MHRLAFNAVNRQVLSRQLHGSKPVGSFFKNLQENIKKGMEDDKDIKAAQEEIGKIDMKKMAEDMKKSGEKYAESDKFKKIMK